MLTCKEFDAFMLDYLGGDLPGWQKFQCWLHIKMCRECAYFVRQYSRITSLGQKAFESPDDPVPDAVPEELIKAALSHRRHR